MINFSPWQHYHQIVICFYCMTQSMVITHQCAFRPPLALTTSAELHPFFYYFLLVRMVWIYSP